MVVSGQMGAASKVVESFETVGVVQSVGLGRLVTVFGYLHDGQGCSILTDAVQPDLSG